MRKMGKIIVLPETTQNPISLIGMRAGVCWGADITDAAKNYKRGLECIENNHGRTLEYVNVELVIDGYSARVIREWYTHLGGSPTRLQASTRYINYKNFEYITPHKIEKNEEAKKRVDETMKIITENAQKLEEIVERLQDRRADALLHTGHQLAVNPAEQQAGQEAEQEPREDQDIGQILEAVKNDTHIPASLTE